MWPKRLQGQRKVVGQVEQEGKEGCDVWKGSSDPDVVSCDPDVLVLTDTLPSCVPREHSDFFTSTYASVK